MKLHNKTQVNNEDLNDLCKCFNNKLIYEDAVNYLAITFRVSLSCEIYAVGRIVLMHIKKQLKLFKLLLAFSIFNGIQEIFLRLL